MSKPAQAISQCVARCADGSVATSRTIQGTSTSAASPNNGTTQPGARQTVGSLAASAPGATLNTVLPAKDGSSTVQRGEGPADFQADARNGTRHAFDAQDRPARARRTPRRLNSSAAPNRR
jgi:hypothetical protein